MKLKKGDNVKVLSGKDRGKTAAILRSFPTTDKVILDGLNVFNKRTKPRKQGEKGQIVAVSRAMPASNVMLICPNCKKPTRIGSRIEGSKKVRYCKKCQANI
jgi:large subunit ribosomal protein L24